MGMAESSPISTLVAPSCSKKLLSKTSAVTQEKKAEKTPSKVEAFRLERMACLLSLLVDAIGAIAAASCIGSRNSETLSTGDFTGVNSPTDLIIKIRAMLQGAVNQGYRSNPDAIS